MLGGIGIAIGLITLGHRVIRTVGTGIVVLTLTRGVAADIGATATILVASRIGLPVSTTHTLVGAVLGVGLARGISTVNTKIVKSIFSSWLATVPTTAGLTVIFYFLIEKILL